MGCHFDVMASSCNSRTTLYINKKSEISQLHQHTFSDLLHTILYDIMAALCEMMDTGSFTGKLDSHALTHVYISFLLVHFLQARRMNMIYDNRVNPQTYTQHRQDVGI